MTTIIILGENCSIRNTADGTPALVNYHVQLTDARFNHQLEERIAEGKQVRLSKLGADLDNYKWAIKQLDEEHKLWSIRDDRVVLFLADLEKLLADVKLLWLDAPEGSSLLPHQKRLQELNRLAFEKFDGEKLRLDNLDQDRINNFAAGKAKKVAVKKDGNGKRDK